MRRRLDAGEVVLGTMVTEFATPAVARLTASAGAEFTLFDLEHTGYGIERMRTVLAAARAADTVPFLRVPDAAYDLIARGLDLGALGVMVPAVESAAEARLVASAARFPPAGRRGFGLLMRDEWEPEGVPATIAKANAETLVLVQIETAAGLDAVEEIAAVEGVDVLWIGHFDLTASLGVPGDFASHRYREAVDRVLAAGAASGKPVGMVCGSPEEGAALVGRGFRLLA
ncbi:MAG TPA: aldolase/citrate lyase family protein, partial [Gaiellaceae bacterium]|nr:aldolase/citrate lyase family protein [Gaiellaceae bacterium]